MLTDFRLKVFKEVAEQLNFSKAAKILHITQPAVSGHIAELENMVGDLLFNRLRNGVSLTPKGKVFLNYCNRILFLYSCADKELIPRKSVPLHSLRIAACPIAAQYLLPPGIEKFKELFPEVEIVLSKMTAEEALEEVRNGDSDLAVSDITDDRLVRKPYLELKLSESRRTIQKLYFLFSKESSNIEIIQEFILTSTETI